MNPELRAALGLWLNAYDNGSAISTVYDQYGNPVSTSESAVKGSGDAYGSTLYVKLREGWNLRSEYAWSYNNTGYTSSGTPSTGSRLYGRAWKAGINGLWRKFQLIVN